MNERQVSASSRTGRGSSWVNIPACYLGDCLTLCVFGSLFQGDVEQRRHRRRSGILALVRWSMHQSGWSWLNLILGIWLVISPFVFFLSGVAMWNNVIVGIIIAALALTNTYFKESVEA